MDLKKSPARKSRRWLFISIAIVHIVLLAIVIPLAVVLPKRGHHSAQVLLSLYIYPKNGDSWKPLFQALEAHPKLTFVCIVNPNSGPGDSQYPDSNYDPAVRKLNSYKNVKTIGYVRTGYATRNISTVLAEVNIFAGWASKSPELAMDGIFFDEAPHQYVADAVTFMETVTKAVKNNKSGLKVPKMVVRNPGVIPDPRYDDPNTDVTVIFEEAYPMFESRLATIQSQPKARSKYAFFINAVPTRSKNDLKTFIKGLADMAEYLYVTEESMDFYESFGKMWPDFTAVMPT